MKKTINNLKPPNDANSTADRLNNSKYDLVSVNPFWKDRDLSVDLLGGSSTYTPVGRKLAYVDKHGQLVLLLTQDQIDVWLPLLKQDVIDAERRNDNIDISDDCATITVSCYNETVYSDVQEAVDITHKMAIISFLNTGDYSYEFVIKDGLTDIIVLALSPLKEDSHKKINEVLDRNTFGSISEKNE